VLITTLNFTVWLGAPTFEIVAVNTTVSSVVPAAATYAPALDNFVVSADVQTIVVPLVESEASNVPKSVPPVVIVGVAKELADVVIAAFAFTAVVITLSLAVIRF